MKRSIFILFICVLAALVILSCKDQQFSTVNEALYPYFNFELDNTTGKWIVSVVEGAKPKNLVVPSEYKGIEVYEFKGFTNSSDASQLETIKLPDTIVSIGTNAFSGCNLLSFSVPEGPCDSVQKVDVTCEINGATIYYTTDGTDPTSSSTRYTGSITVGSIARKNETWTVKAIATYRGFNTEIHTVNYEMDLEVFTKSVYTNAESPANYTIPSNYDFIGDEAFKDCIGLTSITIPSSIVSIGASAFFGCSVLTSVTIPSSVTSIGDSAFSSCALTSVTIPSSVTSIGDSVFDNCTNLASVTIPSSVTSIGNSAFMGCTGLTNITIPSSIISIGEDVFSGCTRLASITIPESVDIISISAFEGCTSLSSVTFPSNLYKINSKAFSGCTSLTSVTIPFGTSRIGDYAFGGCTSLFTIRYLGTITGWNNRQLEDNWNSEVPASEVTCSDGNVSLLP